MMQKGQLLIKYTQNKQHNVVTHCQVLRLHSVYIQQFCGWYFQL